MKLIYEKGVNDYSGTISYMADGKSKDKPFYKAWINMLARCYSEKYHQTHPTYIGCSICENWLSLSKFKAWFDVNYVKGHQLDKDIIKRGNKIYSPNYCRYVNHKLNLLLGDHAAARGEYPQGICLKKGRKKKPYIAYVNYCGKRIHLGHFSTVKSAFTAYANAKHKIIIEASREQTDIAIREGLVNHAKALLNEAELYMPVAVRIEEQTSGHVTKRAMLNAYKVK